MMIFRFDGDLTIRSTGRRSSAGSDALALENLKRRAIMRGDEVPLSDRQLRKLQAFFDKTRRAVSLMLIKDGQSPRALLAAILGIRAGGALADDQIDRRGACMNLAGLYDSRAVFLNPFEQRA